MFELLDLM